MPPDNLAVLLDYIWPPLLLLVVQFGFTLGAKAMTQIPDGSLKKLAQEQRSFAGILRLTQHPNRFLLGCEVFGMLCVLLLTFSVARLPGAQGLRTVLELGIPAFSQGLWWVILGVASVLVCEPFGRTLPRGLAAAKPEQYARRMYPFVRLCLGLVLPLTTLVGVLGSALMRLWGIDPSQQPGQVTEEEIRMMVDAGKETGAIHETEKEMIENVFEFDDRTAEEVMTHRTDVVAVEVEDDLEEVLAAAAEGYSRIPVYEEDIDNIIGLLHVKDLLPLIQEGAQSFSIRKLVRKALFVPESKRCKELFSSFTTNRTQLAVVIDEYGGTSGIVTMEDLLESIVGNIQDEYDEEEQQSSKLSETTYTLDGAMPLEEVEDLLDISLPEDSGYETIGGLMVGVFDQIPQQEEQATTEISGVRFTVLESDERRVLKVQAEKLPPTGAQE